MNAIEIKTILAIMDNGNFTYAFSKFSKSGKGKISWTDKSDDTHVLEIDPDSYERAYLIREMNSIIMDPDYILSDILNIKKNLIDIVNIKHNRVLITEWVNLYTHKLSRRLNNALEMATRKHAKMSGQKLIDGTIVSYTYMHELDEKTFLSIPMAGQKSWNEFKNLQEQTI